MQNDLTAEQMRSYENGIRIYARWIARAYIKDMTQQKLAQSNVERSIEEERQDNGHQENIGDHQAAPVGQNTVGK